MYNRRSYFRGGRVNYGLGGALLTLGKNLAAGKGLGSGALKGVGQAYVTPGSGMTAGLGLAKQVGQNIMDPNVNAFGKSNQPNVTGPGQQASPQQQPNPLLGVTGRLAQNFLNQEYGGKVRGERVDYGLGGALLKVGSNLAQGKGFGSGALEGVGKAAITPGSAIGAGAELAGGLLQKSDNPLAQKIGKGLDVASNFAPGGGGIKGAVGDVAGMIGQNQAAGAGAGAAGTGQVAGALGNPLLGVTGQLAQNFLGQAHGGGIPHNPDLAGSPYRMRGIRLMKAGGINEYGDGGNIYAENGVKTPGSDQDQPSGRSFKPGEAFMMSGFENQPDAEGMVSGRERMYVVMPGADGQDPRYLDLRSAAKEFGYDNAAAMARAMGVETERGPGGGLTFSSTTDPAYNQRLLEAFGGESLEDVQSKLGIGRVAYDRERDLPNIVRAASPGGRQSYGGRVRAIRK